MTGIAIVNKGHTLEVLTDAVELTATGRVAAIASKQTHRDNYLLTSCGVTLFSNAFAGVTRGLSFDAVVARMEECWAASCSIAYSRQSSESMSDEIGAPSGCLVIAAGWSAKREQPEAWCIDNETNTRSGPHTAMGASSDARALTQAFVDRFAAAPDGQVSIGGAGMVLNAAAMASGAMA